LNQIIDGDEPAAKHLAAIRALNLLNGDKDDDLNTISENTNWT
jgi:hypothetical protein